MSKKAMVAFGKVQKLIDDLGDPKEMSKKEYREFIEEIHGAMAMRLEGLDEEDGDG